MEELNQALLNIVPMVWSSDHRLDNSWLDRDIHTTVQNAAKRKYLLDGFCIEPEYRPEMGYALTFFDIDGSLGWVHVSESLLMSWLEQLNLLPPEDILWDRKTLVSQLRLSKI